MRRPLEVLAAGTVLGELLCLAGTRGTLLFLLCLCPVLLAFFWRGVRRRILLVLILGAVAGILRLQPVLSPGCVERQLQHAEGVVATFRGRIAGIGPRGEPTRVRYGSVYLLLRESDGECLALGRVLTASGNLSPIIAPTNPGEFDCRAYCRAHGVMYHMQIRRYRMEGRASPLAEGLRRFRSATLERFKAVCPEQEADYLAALLLGDKHVLSEDFYDLYRKNGIAHLFAISGLHTGSPGLVLYHLLWKKCGLSLSVVVTALFLCLYAALTGGDTGVFRNSLMLGLGFLALCLGRSYDLRSAVVFAPLFLPFPSPLQLFQCDFQLSSLAVFSIGGPGRALTKRFAARQKLCAAFLRGSTVFLITLPATSYWSPSLPPYGIFLNLPIIPMTGALLLLGFMLLVVAFATSPLAPCCGQILCPALGMQILFCRPVEHLLFHRILLGRPKAWQLVAYSLYLSLSFWLLLDRESCPEEKRQRTLRLVLFLCVALGAGISPLSIRSRMPRAWVLDIGQGDSIVIEQGSHCITVDGGSTSWLNCGKQVIEPFLMSRAFGIVDAAFLTHADLDHMNGLSYLASRGSGIRVKRVILNPAAETDSYYAKPMTLFREDPETELFFMGTGDVYESFHCLWPPRGVLPEEVNEQSLILPFTANGKRCLFTDDAGQLSEEKPLERLAAPERAAERAVLTDIDLLKVGHYGSRGASSEVFFALLSPDCALISCGWGNSCGHPHIEAMERFRRHVRQVHSTAKEGALSVELLPN